MLFEFVVHCKIEHAALWTKYSNKMNLSFDLVTFNGLLSTYLSWQCNDCPPPTLCVFNFIHGLIKLKVNILRSITFVVSSTLSGNSKISLLNFTLIKMFMKARTPVSRIKSRLRTTLWDYTQSAGNIRTFKKWQESISVGKRLNRSTIGDIFIIRYIHENSYELSIILYIYYISNKLWLCMTIRNLR